MKPSPIILNDLVKIVDKFVRKTKKNRKEDHHLIAEKKRESPAQYYSEFGSLRIGLPRRGGNTTLAFKLLDNYPKSIYVGCTTASVKSVERAYKSPVKRFFSITKKGLISFKPEIIITDCIHYASWPDIKRMYTTMDYCHPIYIHLG
jgi:hypothetical protein